MVKGRELVFKILICFVMAVGIILLISGCEAEKSVTDFMTQAKQVLDQRVGANKDLLEKLKKSGFIGEELYKGINDALTKQADHFKNLGNDSKALDEIAGATVKYWNNTGAISGKLVYLKDGGDLKEARWITSSGGIRESGGGDTGVKWNNSIRGSNYTNGVLKANISTGYYASVEQDLGITPNGTPLKNQGFTPIELVNTSHMKDFNKLLNYKVYVLQSADDLKVAARGNDKIILAKDNTVSSDTIKLAVAEAKKQADAGNKSQARELLNRYFKEAKDNNGNSVSFYQYSSIFDCPITVSKDDPNGNDKTNKPGTDLIISQTLDCYKKEDGEVVSLGQVTENVFQLRLIELNEDVINKIIGGVQGSGQRYIVLDDAIYIVEYPVEVIDSIEVSSTNSYSISTKPSEFTLNLITGEMTNVNGQVIVQQGANFIHTGTSTDPTISGTGAFCVGKEGLVTLDRGKKSNGTADILNMQGGTILLRDYLELTYMPEVRSSEVMVALGRKIRVLNIEGTQGMDFGCFVGTDGEPIEGVPKVSITDIVDVEKLDTQELYKLDLSGQVTGSGMDRMFIELATYTVNANKVKAEIDAAIKQGQTQTVIGLSSQVLTLNNQKTSQESKVDSAIKSATNQKEIIAAAEKEKTEYDKMNSSGKDAYAVKLGISREICDELIKTKLERIKKVVGNTPTDGTTGSNATLANQPGNGVGANNTVSSTTGQSSIESLAVNRTNEIKPVTKFGGDIIDRNDMVDNLMPTHPIYYCIATDFNPIQSNLLNGWVNVENNEKNSLKWWLSFLQTNKFDYSITTNDLNKFLGGNYALSLGDQDYVIVDLETLAKIQLEMDKENEFNIITFARTLFIVVGYGCIAYAMIVMACWAIDTNLDVGVSTLRIVTFGHWMAIKYADELPDVDNGGKRYMTFSKMMSRMIVLTTIGILLTFIDIIGLVTAFLKIFGGIATAAYEMIFGKK